MPTMADPVNVLLIEDDEVDIINLQRALKKNDIVWPLQLANNGIDALELLNTSLTIPKIIILDINMPKMGGIDFLKNLRQSPRLKQTMVFVLTTSNEEKDKIAAYGLNVAGYFTKPLSFADFTVLLSVLNNYIRLCELPDC
jgi:CheY-like chemotaxis protein